MKLWAISDLHLDYRTNQGALPELQAGPHDWLITGGDLCTRPDHLRQALDTMCARFDRVFWVPGNHELWSCPNPDNKDEQLRGVAKYHHLVDVCREFHVLTPEDPFITWPDPDNPVVIAPLFIPYDYSFRPPDVPLEGAVQWAMEEGILCRDEKLIDTHPYPDMLSWCDARLSESRRRLEEWGNQPKVIVNHFPLREDLVRLWRIPRFSIWCGTKQTEAFHSRYHAKVVISGHLHMRATDYRDGVRFEEVSLGYPQHWDQGKGMAHYMREIIPGPKPRTGDSGPEWRFRGGA